MKKTFLLVLFSTIISWNALFAQVNLPMDDSGEIVFSGVVQTKNSLTADNIFDNAKEWLSTKSANFNRSNSEKNMQGTNVWLGTKKSNFENIDALFKNDEPLKLSDKEEKKIIGKIVNKYTGGTTGCIRVIYLEYDLIMEIRDGRYRYKIINFTYTHYNQAQGKQSQIYGWKDEGNCKSKGALTGLLSCEHCGKEFDKFYTYINSDMAKFIDEMTISIDKNRDSDDW
ncbi:MAG: DUF4468 domain-containing protein [Prevotellaceae bacterium]|jgi:hypothetical protein|nr:DUF4468 domain-containing protein [Prevotellaceae bacterium]